MKLLEQQMRWFGPNDPVRLSDIRQAGCTGVVTALHHIPIGKIWPIEEIEKQKKLIEDAGMKWTVIESLPVHESIKKQSGVYQEYIENYKQSLQNVAACGLKVVTYNFMPILDWIRTDMTYALPDGSHALRYEKEAFMVFDLLMLKRPGAENDYTEDEKTKAESKYKSMTENERDILYKNALLGLPGSDEPFTGSQILDALKTYNHIDAAKLKEHLFYFLREITPVAESLDLRLAIHPDDPPFSLLGLPRVVSTANDIHDMLHAVPSPANGICFCTGSLGARSDNNLVEMFKQIGSRIHFLHLRNTRRDKWGNFYEADHLDGDTDMAAIMKEALLLMNRTGKSIPMRPDHGHQMLDDLNKTTYPGYSAIGRLRGLAELRGLEIGLTNGLN